MSWFWNDQQVYLAILKQPSHIKASTRFGNGSQTYLAISKQGCFKKGNVQGKGNGIIMKQKTLLTWLTVVQYFYDVCTFFMLYKYVKFYLTSTESLTAETKMDCIFWGLLRQYDIPWCYLFVFHWDDFLIGFVSIVKTFYWCRFVSFRVGEVHNGEYTKSWSETNEHQSNL